MSRPNLCSCYQSHMEKCHLALDLYILHSSKSMSSSTASHPSMMYQGWDFAWHRQYALTIAYELYYQVRYLFIFCLILLLKIFVCVGFASSTKPKFWRKSEHVFSVVLSFTPSTALCTEQVLQFVENIKNLRKEPETKSKYTIQRPRGNQVHR